MRVNGTLLFTFGAYLLFMLAIGVYFYRKNKNLGDYVLGGRNLNSWVTAMSASASDMSGWLLLGLPGWAYASGLGEAGWIAIGLLIGTYCNWRFVAKRLREYTEKAQNSLTISDFFENRFNDKTKILRILSAIVILVFFLIYTASGFVAGAKLFNTVFGLPYQTALIAGVIVIVSYTFLGGFNAVSWTDFFQGSLMFIAITFVPVFAFVSLGGVTSALDQINRVNPNFISLTTYLDGSKISLITILSMMAWGLGYFGQPHILVRFMAIRSTKQVKQARIIATAWTAISLVGAIFVGMLGFVYLKTPLSGAASETVFMVMINSLFHPLVAGLLLSAILAAIMSTADSQLLVASSALSQDLYHVLLRRNATDKELVLTSRLAVILIAVFAALLAVDPNSNVLILVSYAWAGFGASFGPAILLSLMWKRMTRNGALAGMISGGLTVILWKNLSGGIFDLYELLPAFIIALIAIISVSFLDRSPSSEVTTLFEQIEK
ncbi:MAG: sodium/proline symporter PutP [Firmicutes bacterium HGW-Firmicutes-19]|jgi:sodium/proline symporter|nr:MAG: sodium/proline symporter PutP [Firmicutes bacterium HGW-Firmicutes-19]